jgi:hypothetical protein
MAEDDGNRPVTKAELNSALGDLEARLGDKLGNFKAELIEVMGDMQTEILRAFHNWARPIEIRLRGVDHLSERMSAMEERMSDFERRLPPPAPHL